MTRHLKGCYIDLLIAQFNSGSLSLEEIRTVLGSDFASAWGTLSKKFAQDAAGKFFNERLELEKNKRNEFSKKQTERIKKRWEDRPPSINGNTAVLPKESENENGNENGIKGGAGGLPPSQAMVEEMFSKSGLTESEGEEFYQWVNGTKGWDKINNWVDYSAAVISKKLREKQNPKNGKHNGKGLGGVSREYLEDLERRLHS